MANKDLIPELIPIKPEQNSQKDLNAAEEPAKTDQSPPKKEEKDEKENKEKEVKEPEPPKQEKEQKEIKDQNEKKPPDSPNMDEIRKKKLILLSQKFSKTNNGKKYKGSRRGSASPSISAQFLDQFSLIAIQEENENDEGDRGNYTPTDSTNKKSSYENSREIENTKKLFGIEDKKSDNKNPIKNELLNKINKLKQSQEEINYHFEKDRKIYLRKIEILENALKANFDNKKLKDLEKINQDNKEEIKKKEKELEDIEKEKIRDKKNFHDKLNEIVDLKNILINELKELAIMAKKISFQDYDKYPNKEHCTKIEKLNFRQDDSKYLFTNEYETSREEESFSSYDKLNKINNTPGGLELNKYKNKKNSVNFINNNYNNLGRTEQYFFDMKNFNDNKDSNKASNRSKNNSIFTMGKYNESERRKNFDNSNYINEYINQQKNNKRNSNEKGSNNNYNNYNNLKNPNDIVESNSNRFVNNNKEISNKVINNINNNNTNNNVIISSNEEIDTSSNNNYLRSLERIKNNMPENNIKTKKPSVCIMRKFPKEPNFLPSDMVLIREHNKSNSDVFY